MGNENSSSPFRIGHVLINVKNLKQAKLDFERMGFTVAWGGNPNKAVNAMIFLPEGGFIELFSMEVGTVLRAVMGGLLTVMKAIHHPSESRYRNYLYGAEGFSDYALDSQNEQEFRKNLDYLKQCGIPVYGPQKKARTDEKGLRLKWEIYHSGYARNPFYMSPYHPPLIPDPSSLQHANGAAGIKELWVQTSDWEQRYGMYGNLYRQEPAVMGEEGKRSCRFQVGTAVIVLIEGTQDRIVRLVLTSRLEKSGKLKEKFCHGAEIWLQAAQKPAQPSE